MDETEAAVYRARQKGRRVPFRESERLLVYQRDHGICGICGDPVDEREYEIDHIIPVSGGGKHHPNNWQLAHPSCNRRKGGYTKPKQRVPPPQPPQSAAPAAQFLTVQDIAARLGTAPRIVRGWLREGRMPAKHLGGRAGWRIRSEDFNAFANQLETN